MSKNDFKSIPTRAKEGEITCDWGGCNFKVMYIEGVAQQHCALHHKNKTDLYKLKRADVINRLKEIREHPDSRNLEIELALLRSILEETLNSCTEAIDFVRNSGSIGALIEKIERLLKSNVAIAQATGTLMSIEEVVTIAQALVAIVTEYLDQDDLAEIVERFQRVILEHSRG